MSNYFRTTNGTANVRTDRNEENEPIEPVADWLERHVTDVLNAVDNGWLVGPEICTRWETAGSPGYHEVCTARLDTETPNECLDRHFEAVAQAIPSNPPS